jgi:DNA repair protein SbcC/Rad50
MTLTGIQVRNFQSLREVNIEPGQFTVVTGPSNSGKSALFRAILMLARNARGTDYISAGQDSCTVTAGNHLWIARLARSRAPRGPNEYRLRRRNGGGDWEAAQKFTKLGGQVPEEVSAVLQLSELNFAGQFDPPYLLTASGTAIARTLGELTNVSLVLSAAGRAGQLRKQLSRDLDAARARRDALLEEARQFAGLKTRRQAAQAAEEALSRAQELSARRDRLRALTARLETAQEAAEAARREAARCAPPSLERLGGLEARRARLRELALAAAAASRDRQKHLAGAEAALAGERAAAQGVHAALAEAGQCPVCGQGVAA